MKKYIPLALALAAPAAQAVEEVDVKFNAHLNAAVGTSSVDEAALASHAHDPNDEFTLQGLELNASARYADFLSGFVAYNAFLDDENNQEGEFEEAFLKLTQLPLGTEIRAGRLLNRVGTQNNVHLHGWRFADSNLDTTRFLGEEGLLTNSVELSFRLPVEHEALVSVAYGDAVAHEEHGHDDDDEHHFAEEILPMDDILSARLKGVYKQSDFKKFVYGASAIFGDNETGESTKVYGADLSYIWRENGTEAGGREFRATVAPIYREFDVRHAADEIETGSEWGLHTQLGYSFNADWDADIRFDYLEGFAGEDETIDERHRTSVALTRNYQHDDNLGGHVRLQYNHDWHEHLGQEDSIWLQFQIDFGPGGEVR